ncbi:COG4315 family predicted lipoprotein [Actinopolymorpha cephalotaxi]|uniref:Lipoprotein with Yx(FWY)xxD motif n=1 Tax=Actinopolymorpha cephalotaxi TaxID=504797 RepID=A0ABX2S1G9_9ACTN|nr:hypothetical protein [Actinopolymorpha cephalotaxi]NYH82034.1 putative lipoprotein with Yx(FWY)xxD motif [Actinopolymorpha cephalotaxi]
MGTLVIPGVGRVLTDASRHTVYVHDGPKDPRKPHCIGVCTNVWHPVVVAARTLAPDLPGTGLKVSVLPRPGGLDQLTIGGRRAYTFVDDKVPGDAHGINFITGIGPNGPMVTWGVVQLPAKAPDSLPLRPGTPGATPTHPR